MNGEISCFGYAIPGCAVVSETAEKTEKQKPMETEAPDEPTRQLYQFWHFLHPEEAPDATEVERVIREGADVNWKPSPKASTSLVGFAYRRQISSLLACLSSAKDIDFSLAGGDGATLLHIICDHSFPRLDGVRVLDAIVHHIERHPQDCVNWGQKDWAGRDFIRLAANEGFLSYYYPLVRDMPYFGDRVAPIELKLVRSCDWACLSEEDKKNFVAKSIV